jgi:hypothetical protein
MTDSVRIDRATLVRRAAALAGGAYVAPVLTSSAAAEARRCPEGLQCASGKKGLKKCRKKGGKLCSCCDGRCTRTVCEHPCFGSHCDRDPEPCTPLFLCSSGNCACFNVVSGSGITVICADLQDGQCDSFPQCDRTGNGLDCPRGTCCVDTCCPTGICVGHCFGGRERMRTQPSGPTLYRVG